MRASRVRMSGPLLILAAAAGTSACSTSPPPARPELPPIASGSAGASLPGKVVWRDLLTHAPDEAVAFYGELFGWTFEAAPGAPTGYRTIRFEDTPVGGMFAVDPDDVESPLWLVSVSVPTVDEAARTARNLGATLVTEPAELPDRGRYAVIRDPQGAFIVLLRAMSGDPADDEEIGPGDWLWTELWTTEAAGAVSFYQELLGYRAEGVAARLAETAEEDEADGEESFTFFVMFADERPRSGIQQLPVDAPPHWLPYVAVADVGATVARAKNLGARIVLSPDAVRNEEAAILVDPTGAPFGIQQWPRAGGDR